MGKITPAGVTTLFPLAQGTTLDPNLGVHVDPTNITAGPDGVLWFCENGAIGRITTAGTIEQFALTTPGATPANITVGPDDTLWFVQGVPDPSDTGVAHVSIGRITTAGAITVFPLPAGVSVGGMTEGRDGNVWFTESITDPETSAITAPAVARITPEGRITRFAVPIPKTNEGSDIGSPAAIAVGPDGHIWFTGDYAAGPRYTDHSFLGRVTARGQVRLFPLPASTSSQVSFPVGNYTYEPTYGLIAGPDGKLWFDSTANGKTPGIARISTGGESGRFTPVIDSGDMTRRPNGQVWFPSSDNHLALATRSGIVVTEDLTGHVASNDYGGGFRGVTAGPDGNLWVTDQQSSIVRISGLDTPLGGLDYRHRSKQPPDYENHSWTNITGNAHPTFAGVARPGSEVTLSVQRQGENAPVAIGTVHASRSDGSWTLTSNRRLSAGSYAVTATQTGDTGPPSVLYSLEPDASGALSNALVIASPESVKSTRSQLHWTGKAGKGTGKGNEVGI